MPSDPRFDEKAISAMFARIGGFFHYVADLTELMNVIKVGFESIDFAHRARVLAKEQLPDWTIADELANREFRARLRQAKKIADDDFAPLNANNLIGLWGATEAAVEDIAALWFQAQNGTVESPQLERIKVSLGEYVRLDEAGRARLVVREVQRAAGSESRLGVGQFESLLEPLGLGGTVAEETKRQLLFAQQARHLIAHRSGVVDSRFIDACGWLDYREGDQIRIGSRQFDFFRAALCDYIKTVAQRMEEVASTDSYVKHLFVEFRRENPLGRVQFAPEAVAEWHAARGRAEGAPS